ncbi:MAG TPA: DUF202 domain-containing protein [Actinomycetota bacterium]
MSEPRPEGREAVDATRRTYLAAERTYLAWWRAGLTAMAVSLGVGRLLPDFATGPRWPFVALGLGFGALGLLLVGYGVLRQSAVDRALRAGTFAPLSPVVLVALAMFGVLLGVGTIVLVLIQL